MTIIIGLGNPGEKFNHTPHNMGVLAIDLFAKENSFPDFSFSKKSNALTSEQNEVLLVKPQTFMNESGKSVKELTKNQPLPILIIVHDDIDMPLGKIKIVKDSGAGGHKGVASIIQHLGSQDFIRVKIGVCPSTGKPEAVEEFVIKKLPPAEQEVALKAAEKASKALTFFLEHGPEKTMNEFNYRPLAK